MPSNDRLVFNAEWFDPTAELVRKYQLMFYRTDGTVEMFDVKNRRLFLKRCSVPHITEASLYVGAIVNVNSRTLTLTQYADTFTERELSNRNERTLAIIKPDAVSKVDAILETISKEGSLTFGDLIDYMVSGPIIAMELMGSNAISRWRNIMGPTEGAKSAPGSLRAKYGTNSIRNALHGSDGPASAKREIDFFFGDRRLPGTARVRDSTLCLIKPHAINEGNLGKILREMYSNGLSVTAMEMFHLDRANAEEFLEVYKGVVTEYIQMVHELCSGPVLALEVSAEHRHFREFVGPADPEIGRHLRPNTLRAKFGSDKVRNAIHCTDLPEDVPLEVEYFFRILSS